MGADLNARPIRLTSDREAEFERLRDRIALEASNAADHFNLFKRLWASRQDYYLEMNVSNTFWHLTFIAHRDAVLSHLCRLYDKDGAALSLGRFLLTVKTNRDLFSDAAFRERLKENRHVETLAEGRAIDDAELDKELETVSGEDPLVAKLRGQRNESISHTDADRVRRDAPEVWLPFEEIEALLDRAAAITSKYSLLYRASMYGGIVGADDFKATLGLVRKALVAREAEIGREFEKAQRMQSSPRSDVEKVQLVHGMRGGISEDHMGDVQAGLPRSLDLRKLNPCLEEPLLGLGSKGMKTMRAHVRLSQGWHLLNEARIALVEADACKLFYEEYEPNSTEAIYWCRFYLDDAALRLGSSCDHLLQCVNFCWDLGVHARSMGVFGKVIAAAQASSEPEVSGEVATSLLGLTGDRDACRAYRNDLVHNERPAIAGVDFGFMFSRQAEALPPSVAAALTELGYPAIGTGRKINELRRVVRNAYCQLFAVYERLAPFVGLPDTKPMTADVSEDLHTGNANIQP